MGLFSSIGKGLKKLGKGVAKVFRSIGRGIKKVAKKVGKAFGELGIVGQIGLTLLMPYIAPLLSGFAAGLSTFAQGTGVLAKAAGVASKVINLAGQFGSKVGSVFKTVSSTVTSFVGDIAGAAARKLGLGSLMPSIGEKTFTGAFESLMSNVGKSGSAIADVFNPSTYSWSNYGANAATSSALAGSGEEVAGLRTDTSTGLEGTTTSQAPATAEALPDTESLLSPVNELDVAPNALESGTQGTSVNSLTEEAIDANSALTPSSSVSAKQNAFEATSEEAVTTGSNAGLTETLTGNVPSTGRAFGYNPKGYAYSGVNTATTNPKGFGEVAKNFLGDEMYTKIKRNLPKAALQYGMDVYMNKAQGEEQPQGSSFYNNFNADFQNAFSTLSNSTGISAGRMPDQTSQFMPQQAITFMNSAPIGGGANMYNWYQQQLAQLQQPSYGFQG